jgi:vitamin B12 transporter
MVLKTNRQFTCGLIHSIKPIALLLLCAPFNHYAQDTLKVVEVIAEKRELSGLGKKSETVDSTAKEQFKFSSVGDVLNYNSAVFIKSYGPGQIATTAFRGGNAEQTAVLWNGFNIQNMMIGQADLALIPSILFENIGVEYGGSTSLWGSGAVGGSIHLNNSSRFGQGFLTTTNLGAGSFGALNASTKILFSKRRFISSTKLYHNRSENNFKYSDSLDKEQPVKRLKNAGYNFTGLMQEFKFLIGQKQILSVNAWLNTNHRRLPAFNPAYESKTYQTDEAVRVSANWSYIKTNFKSVARAGYFNDRIDYTDSLSSVFSKSKVQTIMAENENYFTWHKNQQFNVGVNFLSSIGNSSYYSSIKNISRASLLAGNKFSFFSDKLVSYVSIRAEYFSVGTLPVTGSGSLEFKLTKEITAMVNAAKVYRQPTFNELYWIPSGNPHLKAEQGYTYEGNLSYKKKVDNVSVYISGAAFSRKIDNWILWIPGAGGNPTPVNIQKVWSRGAETTWRINFQKNKFKTGISVVTSYVLSTIVSNEQENNNTDGRQLIYTPRYLVNGNVMAGYGPITVLFFHQYAGYRFTSSDNSRWISPYHLSSLRMNYTMKAKKTGFVLFAACNNLFNIDYSIIAGSPMPLRNFEFGISLNTFNNNNNQ